jgi:hypothetical protein
MQSYLKLYAIFNKWTGGNVYCVWRFRPIIDALPHYHGKIGAICGSHYVNVTHENGCGAILETIE